MATRHLSLQMTEVADLTDILQAFEKHNQVRIEVRMSVESSSKVPDLLLMMAAHPKDSQIGEVAPLASVSVKCSATNLKNLLGAVTHALYALDFQIAVNELDYTAHKKA